MALGFSTTSADAWKDLLTFATVVGATTSVSILYGGTGATAPSGARMNLGAAASGANVDITLLLPRQFRCLELASSATSVSARRRRGQISRFLIQTRAHEALRCKHAPRPGAQRPGVHQHHRRRDVTPRSRFGDSGATSQGRVRYDNNTDRLPLFPTNVSRTDLFKTWFTKNGVR